MPWQPVHIEDNPMVRAPRVQTTTGLGYRRDIAIVFLYGEHDYGSRAMLETELAPLGGTVVVDLSWCAFLDSSIISIILAKHTQLQREGGHLGLRALVQVRERLTYPLSESRAPSTHEA
jgi:anti-anti-sigma regulatory factor